MAAAVVGPARGGDTRATPSKGGGSSMCSGATAKTTVRPTSFTSLTQVVSSPPLDSVPVAVSHQFTLRIFV